MKISIPREIQIVLKAGLIKNILSKRDVSIILSNYCLDFYPNLLIRK